MQIKSLPHKYLFLGPSKSGFLNFFPSNGDDIKNIFDHNSLKCSSKIFIKLDLIPVFSGDFTENMYICLYSLKHAKYIVRGEGPKFQLLLVLKC